MHRIHLEGPRLRLIAARKNPRPRLSPRHDAAELSGRMPGGGRAGHAAGPARPTPSTTNSRSAWCRVSGVVALSVVDDHVESMPLNACQISYTIIARDLSR